MIQLDVDVLASFATLTAGLDGERIGLTIFNGSAVSVFPLTDDAEYIADTLADSATLLVEHKRCSRRDRRGRQLTHRRRARLVRPALRFRRSRRSRSIVFVTDNMLAGQPIMRLPEAAAAVAERDIRVYAIAAPTASPRRMPPNYAPRPSRPAAHSSRPTIGRRPATS